MEKDIAGAHSATSSTRPLMIAARSDISVRPYRPGDEAEILTSFNTVFRQVCGDGYVDRDAAHWRWQFHDNPAGRRIWLAATPDGEIAAHYGGISMHVVTEFGVEEASIIQRVDPRDRMIFAHCFATACLEVITNGFKGGFVCSKQHLESRFAGDRFIMIRPISPIQERITVAFHRRMILCFGINHDPRPKTQIARLSQRIQCHCGNYRRLVTRTFSRYDQVANGKLCRCEEEV